MIITIWLKSKWLDASNMRGCAAFRSSIVVDLVRIANRKMH